MPQNDAKEVKKLERALQAKLKLHLEAEVDKQHSLVREQVLCDLLVHQDFFDRIISAAAEVDKHDAAQLHAVLLQQCAQHAAGVSGTGQHQQHPTLPCSYIAQLLRQSTVAQVQQVLSMSAQDWVAVQADMFPKLLVQLELCNRSSYDESTTLDMHATGASGPCAGHVSSPCSNCSDHSENSRQHILQQQQQPAGTAALPSPHCATLQQTTDDTTRLMCLAYLFNYVPIINSIALRLDGGSGGPPDLQHWEKVADRLELTDLQEQQISILHAEFQRRSESQTVEGQRLVHVTEQSNHQLVAALQQSSLQSSQQEHEQFEGTYSPHSALRGQQQQQQQPDRKAAVGQGMRQGSGESMLLPLEREGSQSWHERLGQQLQTHMRKRLVLHITVHTCVVNTLSTYQCCMFVVASYPWHVATNLVMKIVSKRAQEHQQRQIKDAVQQQQQQRGALATGAGPDNSTDAGAAENSSQSKGPGGRRADRGSRGSQGGKMPGRKLTYGQWSTQQCERARAQELALHQRACWAQLGCELPGEQQQPQAQPQPQAQAQSQSQGVLPHQQQQQRQLAGV